MYICICKGITEESLKKQFSKKISRNSKDFLRTLGIGKDCGICYTHALDFLQQESGIQKHKKDSSHK